MESIRTFAAVSADPTPAPTPAATLSWSQTLGVLIVVAVALLLIGALVIYSRRKDTTGQSVVRSWIALALVAGLVLFCAVTFAIPDGNLRSTVFGGLTTSVGAAVAFYFSSKSSDQARADILTAMQHATGTPPATEGGNKEDTSPPVTEGGNKGDTTPPVTEGGNKGDGTPGAADDSNASGANDGKDGSQKPPG
jgi:hypothetical protein